MLKELLTLLLKSINFVGYEIINKTSPIHTTPSTSSKLIIFLLNELNNWRRKYKEKSNSETKNLLNCEILKAIFACVLKHSLTFLILTLFIFFFGFSNETKFLLHVLHFFHGVRWTWRSRKIFRNEDLMLSNKSKK